MNYRIVEDVNELKLDIIDSEHRHKGLGKALVSHIVLSDELQGLRGILITKDAQKLYSQFGFEVVNDRVMFKNI